VYAPVPEYPGLRLAVHSGGGSPSVFPVRPEGRLQVRLLVRADGVVGTVDVVASSGDPELDRAAVQALARWRFEPARRDGQPVDSYYLVWVTFEARGPGP
jgi:protein TonB